MDSRQQGYTTASRGETRRYIADLALQLAKMAAEVGDEPTACLLRAAAESSEKSLQATAAVECH